MKVNVYRSKGGTIQSAEPNSRDDILYKEEFTFLGTIDLPIEKREVEKVLRDSEIGVFCHSKTGKRISNYIPIDAYDITVHYKVKE